MLVLPWHRPRLRPLFQFLSVLLAAICVALPQRVLAEGQRVIIVSSAEVPEELEKGVSRALSDVCYVSDSRDYLNAVRNQKLSPTDEAALTRVGPKAHARMLVVLDFGSRKLQVTYRDGKNGSVLQEQTLPARGRRPKLSARNGKKLKATARSVLAKLSGQSAPPIAADSGSDDDADEEEDDPVAAAPVKRAPVAAARTQQAPQRQAAPTPAADTSEESSGEEGESEGEAPADEERAASGGGSSGGGNTEFNVRLMAGSGAGGRALSVPTRFGASAIDTGFSFPSLLLGIQGQGVFGSGFILGGGLEYRALFGAKALQVLGNETHMSSVSSHSLNVGVAPGFRFGEKGSADLRVFLGYHWRSASPADTALPGATSAGIVLRPELRIPFAGELFTLRIAPELLVALTHDTRLLGNVAGLSSVGIGFGGEISLDLRLSSSFLLGVEYRESHVSVSSGWTTSFSDVERYANARIILQL